MFTADPVVISAMTRTGKFIRMVAFLAVGVTSLMCQSQIVLAQSAPGIAAASRDDEKVNTIRRKTYPGQIYANTDVLVCGKETVVITSTCVANDGDNSDPYCFSQNVSFVQIQKRQAVSFFYSYEQDKQKFIYGAACLKH